MRTTTQKNIVLNNIHPVLVNITKSLALQVAVLHGLPMGAEIFLDAENFDKTDIKVRLDEKQEKKLRGIYNYHLNGLSAALSLAYLNYMKEAGLVIPKGFENSLRQGEMALIG